VQALTGIDPDRLREEKDRGMTIDLGFAWLTLPSGREVSLVDVPGHERFIKNMLAGVGGIDLALLVVAADEGVMPQTREHLAILDLLGIASGVVAITKSDLVDAEWLELVVADVEEVLQGTALAGAAIITCSAITRAGLPELLASLEQRLDATPAKRDIGRPRLSIDRAFTISGFGTVVTGTLVDGSLRTGQEVELLPREGRARIRGLQMHRQRVERVEPGSRTAVNLAGVSADDLPRGTLLTTPGWLQPTTAADVRLQAVAGMARPIKHNMMVTFHAGAAEVPAKVRLLDRAELASGETCWAQIRLAAPAPLVKGESFIIRTPNETAGGGAVVDSHPKRHRRHHQPTLAALETLERGSPADALLSLLAKLEPADPATLVRETDLGAAEAQELITGLVAAGRAVQLGEEHAGALYTAEGYRRVLNSALRALEAFFAERPLRLGMPREELKSRLGLRPKLFNDLLARWLAEHELVETGALVGLPGRSVRLTAAQERAVSAFLTTLRASAFSPPSDGLPEPELLSYLAERGEVVPVGEGIVFAAEAYGQVVARITEHLQREGSVTLAQVRDLLGTSRKYAQAILEHLDEIRMTRRVGDERVLRAREGAAR
jgi:selenocysteine-specific elongation factor